MRIMIDTGATLAAGVTAYAAAYTNVLLIPGPSFVVVCDAGLSATRRAARLVAAGVACGAAVLAATILQAAPMLRTSPGLVIIGQIGCALIMLGMGARILQRSFLGTGRGDLRDSASGTQARFMTGFVAAATNPVSFASFTTAALRLGRLERGTDFIIVAATIFLMAVAWFNTLALMVSHPVLTVHYGRVARTLGSVMGCVLMAKALAVLVPAL